MSSENARRVGEYEILSLIGSGGMGRVYKVRNIVSNREEAMKVLLPDFAAEPELAARFMAEIRTLAGLEHPNIAQLRTAFQVENQFVMVMELVEGTSLDKLAPQLQGSLETLMDYSMQVLAALSYAHCRGVTHRDIKPANIMITSHGVVKLMDFGIAKSKVDMNLTRPGTTMGSIYYMSPEQVRGDKIDARSDIYSFGVTLYEMLTGQKPFQAETSYSVLHAQLNVMPVAPALTNPAIPQQLSDIVMRAMAKDPSQRFQTAEEFRNALKSLHGCQPAAQPMPQPVEQSLAQPMAQPAFTPVAQGAAPAAQRPGKSHRALWVTFGAAATVLVLAAAGILLPRFFSMHAGQKPSAANSGTNLPTAADTMQQAASAPAAVQPGSAMAGTVSSAPPATPTASPATNTANPRPATGRARQSDVPSSQYIPPERTASGSSTVQAPTTPPALSGPSSDVIRQARDRFTNLDARAQAAGSSVAQLRRQQQAEGLDLRGDIVASMARMNSYMHNANQALGQNDPTGASDYMDRAEKEIENLEAFMGR